MLYKISTDTFMHSTLLYGIFPLQGYAEMNFLHEVMIHKPMHGFLQANWLPSQSTESACHFPAVVTSQENGKEESDDSY